jgi:hypothetical protein
MKARDEIIEKREVSLRKIRDEENILSKINGSGKFEPKVILRKHPCMFLCIKWFNYRPKSFALSNWHQ